MTFSSEAKKKSRQTGCAAGCGCCSAARIAPPPDAPGGRRLVLMVLLVFLLPLAAVIFAALLVRGETARTVLVFGLLAFILMVLPAVFRLIFKRKVKMRNECNA